MSKTLAQTFGLNNTPITTIRHTATASWDGFIYQGLCGLYVALRTLSEDFENRNEWNLGVEGYEDFVIQDDKNQIMSFHQCKCYQSPSDFKKEYEKMEDKRAYWYSNGLCADNVPLYFHCNIPLKYSNGVQAYNYKNGKETASPLEIYSLIKDMVQLIMKKQNIPGSHEAKTAQLIFNIEHHVSNLHQAVMNLPDGENAFNYVTSNPIKLELLKKILTNTSSLLTKQEKAFCCRYYFELYLNECMLMRHLNNDYRVKQFIQKLECSESEQLLELIQRINPDVNINKTNAESELEASSRPNNFYQVLTETLDEIDSNKMRWLRNGEIYSPTTLGQDLYPDQQCAKIINNDNISALLWDFRWLVGNVKSTVDDVREESKNITAISIDYRKFTKPEKLGLMTIKDFNDDKY